MNLPDPLQINLVRQGGTRLGLVDILGQARRQLFESLAQGRDEGLRPPDLARQIRDQIPAGRFRTSAIWARVIARTETKWPQNKSSIAVYRRGGNWRASRVTDAQLGDIDEPCNTASGQVWTFERADANPLQHPNCTRSFQPHTGEAPATLLGAR